METWLLPTSSHYLPYIFKRQIKNSWINLMLYAKVESATFTIKNDYIMPLLILTPHVHHRKYIWLTELLTFM